MTERWYLYDQGYDRGRLVTPHGEMHGDIDALWLAARATDPQPTVIVVEDEPPLVPAWRGWVSRLRAWLRS